MVEVDSYTRVIPRDLFNESKLLKCLGQLALIALDGVDSRRQSAAKLYVNHDGEAFDIRQNPDDGGLYCDNVRVKAGGKRVTVFTTYNSKEPFPMYCRTREWEEFSVFNDDGSLSEEFAALVK